MKVPIAIIGLSTCKAPVSRSNVTFPTYRETPTIMQDVTDTLNKKSLILLTYRFHFMVKKSRTPERSPAQLNLELMQYGICTWNEVVFIS